MDTNVEKAPEVTVPEGFRKSPYDQKVAYKRIEDTARQIAGEMTEEQRGGQDLDHMTESVMADFIANALSFAIYDGNLELVQAIIKKAEIQALAVMKQDAQIMALAAAVPAGRA